MILDGSARSSRSAAAKLTVARFSSDQMPSVGLPWCMQRWTGRCKHAGQLSMLPPVMTSVLAVTVARPSGSKAVVIDAFGIQAQHPGL